MPPEEEEAAGCLRFFPAPRAGGGNMLCCGTRCVLCERLRALRNGGRRALPVPLFVPGLGPRSSERVRGWVCGAMTVTVPGGREVMFASHPEQTREVKQRGSLLHIRCRSACPWDRLGAPPKVLAACSAVATAISRGTKIRAPPKRLLNRAAPDVKEETLTNPLSVSTPISALASQHGDSGPALFLRPQG